MTAGGYFDRFADRLNRVSEDPDVDPVVRGCAGLLAAEADRGPDRLALFLSGLLDGPLHDCGRLSDFGRALAAADVGEVPA